MLPTFEETGYTCNHLRLLSQNSFEDVELPMEEKNASVAVALWPYSPPDFMISVISVISVISIIFVHSQNQALWEDFWKLFHISFHVLFMKRI